MAAIPTADPRESGSAFMPELRAWMNDTISGPSFLTAGAAWNATDVLTGEATGEHLSSGYDTAGNIAYIRSVNSGTAFTDLHLVGLKTSLWSASGTGDAVETLTAFGGNVGIGHTDPQARIHTPGNLLIDPQNFVGVGWSAPYSGISVVGNPDDSVGISHLLHLVARNNDVLLGDGTVGRIINIYSSLDSGNGRGNTGDLVGMNNVVQVLSVADGGSGGTYARSGEWEISTAIDTIDDPFGSIGVVPSLTTRANCVEILSLGTDATGLFRPTSAMGIFSPNTTGGNWFKTGIYVSRTYSTGLWFDKRDDDGVSPFNTAMILADSPTPYILKSEAHAITNGFDISLATISGNAFASPSFVVKGTGNTGIGVTSLQSWLSTQSALQIGGASSLIADTTASSNSSVNLSTNAYLDGVPQWVRIATGTASNYFQYQGAHAWRVAASGAAASVITWSEAMRITNGGNLGIGTGATVSARVHSLSTTEQLRLGYDATNYASFTVGSSGILAVDTSGGGVRFSDFGAGAARFDSLGNISSDGNGTLHSLSIAGSGTITPAVADLNFQSLSLTGALTGDRTLVWTVTDSPTLMFFHNLSTSSDGVPKALVIKTDAVGSVGSRLPQGFSGWFWHDGTNVYHRSHLMASRGSDVPPVELSGSTHTPPNGSVFIPGHVHVGVPGAGTNAPNVDRFVDGVAYIGLQAYEVYTGPLTDFSKVAGVFGYMVLDPSTDQPAGKEAYGVRGLLQVQTTSTKNFNQIFGTEGVALWGSSGDLDIGYGALGEFQFVGAGDVTDYCAGTYGIFKTFAGATGTAAAALGAVGSVRIDHAITVNFSRSLDALFVQSAGTITGNHVMIHSTTPQITGGTIAGDLYGLRVEDTSSFGAFVGGEMWNIKSFGVNSANVFEGAVMVGGSNLLTDSAPNLGIIKGQNAYAQATTNTTGGNILIAPGIGRRLYTVLDIASGDTTVTITVNGSAVALVGGVAGSGFLYGASTTIAATNLATAINANGTLNTKLKALASGASVYLTEKPPCYSLTIATNQATRISATSGTNGVIDARGHLGVGTGTFKAWASDQSAIQLGGVASFTAEKAAAAGSSFNLSNNAYYDGAWKYAVTDKAANYYQYNGTHNWRIAASGSADAAITWSNAMKIDNTGNLKLAGTAVRATTEGTNHLDIFNGTAPAGALTNGVSLYAVGGKLFAMDSAGVATQLTP